MEKPNETLLNSCVKKSHTSRTRWTHVFSHNVGNASCIKLLLDHNADPTVRMVGGWTPAHCAAEDGRLNSLRVLHDNGAALCLPENTGDTPRRVAEIYGHTECVDFLKRWVLVVSWNWNAWPIRYLHWSHREVFFRPKTRTVSRFNRSIIWIFQRRGNRRTSTTETLHQRQNSHAGKENKRGKEVRKSPVVIRY